MAKKQSGRLALTGVTAALSLVFLPLTASPLATAALAAAAGVCGIPVVMEAGKRAGLIQFVATALLALWLVPTPQGKGMYIAFFGYYTVLKAWLVEKALPPIAEWGIKCAVFLAALAGGGWVLYRLLAPPIPDWFSGWMLPAGAALLCGVLAVYDRCLTGLVGLYATRLRPRLRGLFRF